MDRAERKQTLIEVRELCRKPVDENDYLETYHKVGKAIKDTDFIDYDYTKNLDKNILPKLKKNHVGFMQCLDNNLKIFNFDDCRTLFTRYFRGEHWNEGSFPTHINNKTLFKILERAVEVMP